ncbi:hypothetical protein Tco_0924127 [Tanacetum coccineum]|uniref:Uncharacterized protein n=1 Tax=Tanacetum coccineum TaxID=301880 RepID=A0ABQ5D565_9ASTR
MPKPLTPHHEPSQENNHPNHASPNPYIKDTPTSPQVVSHPPFPISPINSHVTHTQAPPQSDNQTQHTPPLSPSRESLVDDINQLQDLSNLLAMHLSQQQNNIPSSPYSPNLPHTLNINQVETHVGKAKIAVGEGITRSVFRVKGIELGQEEAPYWTTLGKRESYKPRPSSDGVGARTPYYARKDFLECHLPEKSEIARDAEINPLKDVLVFRRMVIFDEKKLGSS